MILFINVLITKNQFSKYPRFNLPSFNRLDIFKYSLASLSVINFSKVLIFAELEPCFIHREQELHDYCNELFGAKLELNTSSIMAQNDWESLSKGLPDEPIFLLCNDDHIFIDSNLDLLNLVENELRQHEKASFYLSHWPEIVRLAANLDHERIGPLVKFEHKNTDSVQIVTKGLFDYWIYEGTSYTGPDKLHQRMRRTDKRFSSLKPWIMYAPLKETCRHFDGYGHVIKESENLIPPLAIPDGFFYNDVKILYCPIERRKGWTHLNPAATYLYAKDLSGVDYRWFLSDIPLFWRDRVSDAEIVQILPLSQQLKSKNNSDMLNVRIRNSTWFGNETTLPPKTWTERKLWL